MTLYGLDSLPPRFRSKVSISEVTGCWEWTASLRNGYAAYGERHVNLYGHRVAYEWLVGPIPEGLDLDHLCRNRPCVNPEHLEPVSRRVNLLRGETLTAKNATATECPQGHEYNSTNTYVDPEGFRHCKTCRLATSRRLYRERRDYINAQRRDRARRRREAVA
ncbi:MAG: HNH endonuclease signature motif containing protein [Pseudonocardiaceae bacterium]